MRRLLSRVAKNGDDDEDPQPNSFCGTSLSRMQFVGIVLGLIVCLKLLAETMYVLPDSASLLRGADPKLNSTEVESLRTAHQEIQELQSRIEELVKNSAAAGSSSTAASSSTPTPMNFDPTDVCSVFPNKVSDASASILWQRHLARILEASKNPRLNKAEIPALPDDSQFAHVLEQTLGAARMRRAIRHLPTFRHDILERVFGIIEKRLQDPAKNPPLRIAVFGGSVTIGRECIKGRMQFYDCAWPKRLEMLINQFVGAPVVEVFNLGVGGTSSSTGTNRIKYWMYGRNGGVLAKVGPDVVINSYSTNDSLPPWNKKWPEDDLVAIVHGKIHDELEPFVREALLSKGPCEVPPLVVHVDDYLGPQQPALLGELVYVQEMTQLAKHYDTMAVSYAEVVRDLVYQNQEDRTFAGKKDVHFGALGHATIAWAAGFASLELLINYCDDKHNHHHSSNNLDKLAATAPLTKETMQKTKRYLPPRLTRDFLLADATTNFGAALEESYQRYEDHDCVHYDAEAANAAGENRNPCIVSWISTPGNFASGDINNFMKHHRNGGRLDGWQAERQNAEGWSNKDGWIATKANAVFEISFAQVAKEVRTVSLYFLRSYGEKWEGSKAKFTVLSSGDDIAKVVAEHEIAGVHAEPDYKYSLTLSETIELREVVPVGGSVTLRVDLVGGSHFKIMGMMFCNK